MKIEDLNSLEKIQKFLDDNSDLIPNVLSVKSKKYRKVGEIDGIQLSKFWYLITKGKMRHVYNKLKWSKKKNDLSMYNTVEDFQYLIDSENISSARQFAKTYSGIYSRAQDLGLLIYLNYSNNPSKSSRRLYLKNFTSVEDYDKIIIDNQLSKPYRLKEFDERLYRRFLKSGFYENYVWPYIKDTKRHFILEDIVAEILESINIEFLHNKHLSWLPKNLSIDFYSDKYGFGVECQGTQHFTVVDYFGGESGFIERKANDLIKLDSCKSNNIDLLYYCDPVIAFTNEQWEKGRDFFNNYIGKIYTTPEDLLQKIKEIIKNKKQGLSLLF